jgi:tetratricopeptide (TPR) repeat protein
MQGASATDVLTTGGIGWIKVLLLMCGAGAFGGMLDVLQLVDIRKLVGESGPILASKKRFMGALILGALGGMGGSISMLFVIVATSKLETSDKPTNILLLISLGMISGFLGYRVLRSVAQKVEKQLEEMELRTDKKIQETAARVEEQTTKKIVESKKILQREVEYSDAITTGKIVRADEHALPSTIEMAMSQLRSVLEEIPDDRQATIILSNLYTKKGDYDNAISLLTGFIEMLQEKGGRNKDIADALYNRACFINIVAEGITNNLAKREELKHKVFADLERSFRLAPSNREEAKNDPDLQNLLNDNMFKPLFSQEVTRVLHP